MARGIRIEGDKELLRLLRKLPEQIEGAVIETITDEVRQTTLDLREDTPVLSGELRDSTQGEVDRKNLAGTVAITARHAEFVIHGTSKQPANDYVTPVENRVRRRFPERLETNVTAALGKVTK